jgi:hypothetical protein
MAWILVVFDNFIDLKGQNKSAQGSALWKRYPPIISCPEWAK